MHFLEFLIIVDVPFVTFLSNKNLIEALNSLALNFTNNYYYFNIYSFTSQWVFKQLISLSYKDQFNDIKYYEVAFHKIKDSQEIHCRTVIKQGVHVGGHERSI